MPERFKLLCLALVLALVSGEVMDFLALTTSQTFAESEDRCRTLGYDGLAVVSSPEMYRYALRLTEILRATTSHGVYVGLRNSSYTHLVSWDDGTLPASDTPWTSMAQFTDFPLTKYGRIINAGSLSSKSGASITLGLCGNHANNPTEAQGVTAPGQQPTDVSLSLSVTIVVSYLECVLLCGQDHRCRAAEFNSDLLTCMTLGPGSYSGLTANPQS